jgi:putative oxidoreductase
MDTDRSPSSARELGARVLRTERGVLPLVARVAAGVIFVLYSFGKFVNHEAEVRAFARYSIPFPDATVYLVGVLELAGGAALIAGLLTRPAALALAGDMVGAIVTAGRIDGGAVNLGLAPALLVVMLYLVWRGAGSWSVDRVLHRSLAGAPPPAAAGAAQA